MAARGVALTGRHDVPRPPSKWRGGRPAGSSAHVERGFLRYRRIEMIKTDFRALTKAKRVLVHLQ
jgi:hypothetical protein